MQPYVKPSPTLPHRIGDLETKSVSAVIAYVLPHRIGDLESKRHLDLSQASLPHRIGDLEK